MSVRKESCKLDEMAWETYSIYKADLRILHQSENADVPQWIEKLELGLRKTIIYIL